MVEKITFISFVLLMSSCSGGGGSMNFKPETKAQGTPPPLAPTFASLDANVFKPKCATCHTDPEPDSGIDLSSYESIMRLQGLVVPGDPANSLLYVVVVAEKMPKGSPLSADEKDAIHDWILEGALKNPPTSTPSPTATPVPTATPAPTAVPTPTATPAPNEVRFSKVSEAVFKTKCVSCHSGIIPSGLVDLTTYKKVIAKSELVVAGKPEKSKLWTEVNAGKMPPVGNPAPTAAEKKLIFDWITQGALE
jgi:hypothetical protein